MLFTLKKVGLFALFIFAGGVAVQAQVGFSIATDASLLRNLTSGQKFTTLGQTITANFHINKKQTVYAGICYYVRGGYKNTLVAVEKDTTGGVTNLKYISNSKMGYQQISLGLKHYFAGGYDNEEGLNIYGTAGFGLLSGKAENVFDRVVDSARYKIPEQSIEGSGRFKRLTFDLSLGAETALAAGFFLYGELRTWLPASSYPSPYLYNNNTPDVLLLNVGVRILFE
jgi:opacity protein-like surface antigen